MTIAALFASCSTTKNAQTTKISSTPQQEQKQNKSLDYIRKVGDQAVYAQNIVSKINFTIDAMGRDVSVDGKLNMRRNECIRITLVPFGLMEVGRLEFTPDYVLIMDRMHKEYVKASYGDIDFLKNNGIDFYTLQAYFWNELCLPGRKQLSDSDYSQFTADMAQQTERSIDYKSDKFVFSWLTDVSKAQITKASVNYGQGTSSQSSLAFEYSSFVPMGSKRFPSVEKLSFNTKAANNAKVSLTLKLSGISDDKNWEPRTDISDKYRMISAEEAFSKIMSL